MPHVTALPLLAPALLALAMTLPPQPGTVSAPIAPPSADAFAPAEAAIRRAIGSGQTPGAVLVVGTSDRILYRRAFGLRGRPADGFGPMTPDTVFDLASLTKPIATGTSVVTLISRGRLQLSDPVSKHLPEFTGGGKEAITVEQLLRHTGGLIPDNPMADYAGSADDMWAKICALKVRSTPGTKFEYTDVGFIVLARLVERVAGQPFDAFFHDNVAAPLGLKDTTYKPGPDLRARAAPTEQLDGRWLVGQVHDPRAHALEAAGTVAGHAGLFSTADDVAVWCQALLKKGINPRTGAAFMPASAVAQMTAGLPLPDGTSARGLGVDVDSSYAPAPRGELFPKGSTFGHTGWTGTAFWIDPAHDCFYVLLTNRVYPDGKGNVSPLRRQVATAVAAAVLHQPLPANFEQLGNPPAAAPATAPASATVPAPATPPAPEAPPAAPTTRAAALPRTLIPTAAAPIVLTGIDVLARDGCKQLQGKRVALVTNHSGRDFRGNRTVDLLHKAPGVTLVRLFSPEHGLYGNVDEKVGHGTDAATGLKVYSLYGKVNRPTPEMLDGVDTLVFDIQDAGARFYTYSATLGLCMESAAEKGNVQFVVLDRPNPIRGDRLDGPIAQPEFFGFTAYGPLPVQHGMTFGELAQLYTSDWPLPPPPKPTTSPSTAPAAPVAKTAKRLPRTDLTVIKMEGWRRTMWFDETNLTWVNPSPNLRNLHQEVIYPAVCLIEATNLSVGRGTDEPFCTVGAPWIDGPALAAAMNSADLPGLRFYPIEFTPTKGSKLGEQLCSGVYLLVTDRNAVQPVRTGLTLAWNINRLHPKTFELAKVVRLLQNRDLQTALETTSDPATLPPLWQADLDAFTTLRALFLLYPT